MNVIHVREERRAVLRIVAIYALLGGLWIYLSDSALGLLVHDPRIMTSIATYKGLLFIAFTSSLLFFLISRYVTSISEKNRLLKISEERFQTIYHGISDALFIHDAGTGKILSVNRTACEKFGYASEELLAMTVDGISLGISPYSQDEALEWLKRAAKGTPQKFEWNSRRKDGSIFWTEISMRAETIGDDHCIIVSVRDISERKRHEELLKQSHLMLENLSHQVPGVLFQTVLTPEGRLSTPYASEKLYDIYELWPAEISTDLAPLLGRFHPDDYERIMASINESVRTLTRWECEYRVLLPRQGLKWLYGTAQPQKLDDGSVVMYGIIMDVSERKRSEELLRLSEEKFATAFRMSPDAVTLTRRNDGAYLDVNEGFTGITGYTPEEVIGRSAFEINIWVNPQDRARLVQELEEQGIVRNLEAEFRRKDGTVLIGAIAACMVEVGGDHCLLSITRDITERVNIQKEMLKMQKLESLGVLAGGIAHDFNNILTAIMGNISFARMFLDPSHRSSALLQEAEKASQRATDLAHQLLTFAKGGQPIKHAVSARQLVEASASLVLRGSNVQSVISIPDDLSAIEVDEGQINQAFNNIIINAAQAMPSGGMVTISAENVALGTANPLSLAAGNYVSFTFADTGCGMSEETMKRIFDPYFTTKAGGNGLGLASAYSIITKHGGHIAVHSAPGQGTSFDILLPASSREIPESAGDPALLTTAQHEGKPVLVMDDEAMIRELAAEMLKELGFRVRTCANGDEAVALYKEAREAGAPFRAVIMDLTIPGGMGGKDAARQILDFDPDACLIVSSGYSHDPVMADYSSFGFKAAIVKPYNFAELLQLMTGLPA